MTTSLATTALPATPAEFAQHLADAPPSGFPAVYAPLCDRIGRPAAARMYYDACLLAYEQHTA